MKTITAACLILVLCLACPRVATVSAARFIDLGYLSDPNDQFFPSAISADGSVVCGYTFPRDTGQDGGQPFRWTEQGGMVGLGIPPGASYAIGRGMSADGSTIVGWAMGPNAVRAMHWSMNTGVTFYAPLLDQDRPFSLAIDISNDKSITAGNAYGPSGDGLAVFWPHSGIAGKLGQYPSSVAGSGVAAISADARVIVGGMSGSNLQQAYRWTQNGGVIGLGDLPGVSQFSSYAADVSADGSVVVGTGNSARHRTAFRWTSATGMVSLGALIGPEYGSEANAVSRDGKTIVGDSANSPFIWTQQDGMRSITDLLQAQGVDLTGWRLYSAAAVSDNGQLVTGWGWDPEGHARSWLADLSEVPEPPISILVAVILGPAFVGAPRMLRGQYYKYRH